MKKLSFKNLKDIDWIIRKFVNRTDALVKQTEAGYVACKNLSTRELRKLLERQIDGRDSFAAYATDTTNRCKWMAWDFDFPASNAARPAIERGLKNLRREVAKLEHTLKQNKVPFSIVFSGRRGFHVIVFFDRPVPASVALSLLTRFQLEAKLREHKDLHIDLFPKSGEPREFGAALKIPGAIHRKTGEKSGWVRFSPSCLTAVRARALALKESSVNTHRSPGDITEPMSIRRFLENVYAATEGNRNVVLSRMSFQVGRLIGSGQVNLDLATSKLQEAAKAIGLPQKELQTTIANAIGKGMQHAPQVNFTASNKPTMLITHDEMRLADEVISVIAKRDELFTSGGKLMRVKTVMGSTQMEELPEPSLREIMADSVNFACDTGDRIKPCGPPLWLVKAIAKRGNYPSFRQLREIVNVPILRKNGELLLPGEYDAEISVLCVAGSEWKKVGDKIPKRVSRKMARDAALKILSIIQDFPFQEERDRYSALAAMLTLIMKPARAFLSPMFAITANLPGTGKTLLADAIAMVSTGRDVPRMTLARDEAEIQKSITSLLLGGTNICLLDNVDMAVNSPTLNASLTGEQWSARLLGQNQIMTAHNVITWFVTGNNLRVNRETHRRTILIRLRSHLESPQHRKRFAHANLKDYIDSNRLQLVALMMTIVRGFAQARNPRARLRVALGSFKDWDCVRQVLVWLGFPDVVEEHEAEINSADPETQDELELVKLLSRGKQPFKVDDLFSQASEEIVSGEIRDVLNRFENRPTRNSTGRLLRKLMDRPMGGYIVRRVCRANAGYRWSIEKADQKLPV